jgi:hypothetical protein
MSAVVYDAAVLVAADRNDRRAWAEHKDRLELGLVPLVSVILTSDRADIERLVRASGHEVAVIAI